MHAKTFFPLKQPQHLIGVVEHDFLYRLKFHYEGSKTLSYPPYLALGKMTGGRLGNMEGLEKDGEVEEELPKGTWWELSRLLALLLWLRELQKKVPKWLVPRSPPGLLQKRLCKLCQRPGRN